MPLQWTADNVTEVVIDGRWTNLRPIVTVLHVRRMEDNPLQSARDVLNNWQDHIMPQLPNNYTLNGARFVDKESIAGQAGLILPDVAKAVVGGDARATSAPNTATLVRKNIAGVVGRRAGRMYLPPTAESAESEDGILDAATVAQLNTALASFFAGLSSGGVGEIDNELAVVHKVPATTGFSPVSIVTGLAVDALVATMRRRIRR
jgi:hypothetical protein